MKIIVDKPTFPQQSATIQYSAPRAVNIGDVFYRIHRAESKSFYPTCRVCEGKGELTINGITFKCPQCRVEAEAIHIENYAVRRFRVFCNRGRGRYARMEAVRFSHNKNFSLPQNRRRTLGIKGQYGRNAIYSRRILPRV